MPVTDTLDRRAQDSHSWPGEEAALAALVGLSAWLHLRGQWALPPTHNELWGAMAACLPVSPVQRLSLSLGHTLELGWNLATGRCRFDWIDARLPHALSMVAATAAACWLNRRSRPFAERLLTALFLVGTWDAAFYGHHGRPYAWLYLGAVLVWAQRDIEGFSPWRAVGSALATLSLPMGAPLSAAVLAKVWLKSPASRRGVQIEALLLATYVAWELAILRGPAQPLIASYGYSLARLQPGDLATGIADRLGYGQSLPGKLMLAVAAAPLAVGAFRRPWDAAAVGVALATQALAWLWLQPPGMLRYLIPVIVAGVGLAAHGLPRARRWQLPAALVLGMPWMINAASAATAKPDWYWNIEMRAPTGTLLELLRDGDTLVTDAHVGIEHALLPLLAARDVHLIVVPREQELEYPVGVPDLRSVLDAVTATSWSRTHDVRWFPSWPADDLAGEMAIGRRVVVLGIRSLSHELCAEPCAAAWTSPPMPPVLIQDGHVHPHERAGLCAGAGVIALATATTGPWLRAAIYESSLLDLRRGICTP